MKNKRKTVLIIFVLIIFFSGGYFLGTREEKNQKFEVTGQSVVSETSKNSSVKEDSSLSIDNVEATLETTQTNRNLPQELIKYSDEEIEYARVWLAVMGEDYLENIGTDDFNLNVSFIKKGEPLYYAKSELEINLPQDTILLTGNGSAQGQIFYSSNFDGTVSVYPMPSHWHQTQEEFEDDDYMGKYLESILSNKQIVSIPAGNPTIVKELIQLDNIYK